MADLNFAHDPMQPAPANGVSRGQPPTTARELPPAAIDLANRMFDLARQGNLDLLDYLKAGLPPNLTNNRGDTLLMLAAYHGQTELVKRMLNVDDEMEGSAGASQMTDGGAPPQQATPRRRTKPDPNQLNGRGQSIVAGAVFKGYTEVVKLLIEHGADPTAGQPSAEDTARMFNRWDGEDGLSGLFTNAPGRGVGAREAGAAVEDIEEARRVPGVGLQTTQASQA